jgi:subtilisin-like proprotein convertase family protein
MKKLFILLIVLGLTSPIFAQLKSSEVAGNWKYKVITDQGDMTGTFKFVETDGKLSGNVVTTEGHTIPFTKIELKPENVLYLELKTESDLIKVSVTVDGNKYKGIASSYQGEAPITGEKQ